MNFKLITILISVMFSACTKEKLQIKEFPEKFELVGIGTPCDLEPEKSKVKLSHYFVDCAKIDSFSAPAFCDAEISNDKQFIQLSKKSDVSVPFLSLLKVKVSGYEYSILLKKNRKIKHQFIFDPKKKNYKKVQLVGDMNDWNPAKSNFELKNDVWTLDLFLNPGKYNYQLVLDDKRVLDPSNKEKADNNIGGFNSVLRVGISNSLEPKLFTENISDSSFVFTSINEVEKIFVLWENFDITEKYVTEKNGKFTVRLPKEAENHKRSHIRIYAYNSEGISNDLLIPLDGGKIVSKAAQLERSDKHSQVLYVMMVDRFHNGNNTNDSKIDDPDVAPRANYHGGDIAGITQKVKEGYFSKLGINTIWVSPIVQNPEKAYREFPKPNRKYSGYHGYWPINLTKIDHRFGTPAELHELVSEAHKQNINIILDFVSNHVHEENHLFKAHPDWATPLVLPDGTKNIRIWDEQRLTTWFDTFLPTLDYSKSEVVETISDSALYWVETYDIDGFRHDATKHVPEVFWERLTQKLKQRIITTKSKPLFQIGETFGSRELIGSYVNSGMLDAQFDFGTYFDARWVFANDKAYFEQLSSSLKETFKYYGSHSLMGNITGNHDIARFISYAGEGLKFDEDAQEAGWKREIMIKNPVGYQKLSCLTAFLMTIPGVPVIYYGDEIGMPGGGDPDNRRPMKFENLTSFEQKVKDNASKLVNLRRSNLSLLYGDFNDLIVKNNIWVYTRQYFDQITVVAFNKSNKIQTIEIEIPKKFSASKLKINFGGKLEQNGERMKLILADYSFEILTVE